MKISPARRTAFKLLSRIENEDSFSSALLAALGDLEPKDRALCHVLTLGVLRSQILLDRIIDKITKGKKLDPAVRIALRLGLFQVRSLDRIPDHSAVNESVNLVHAAGKSSARSLVNAVLRSALREMPTLDFDNELDRISVTHSHPEWLISKWILDHGVSEAEKIAEANNVPAPIVFREVNPAANLDWREYRRSDHVNGCFLAAKMTERLIEAASAGEIYFQDEGSQLVAAAAAATCGESFLDVCSAPGGKITFVASRGKNDLHLLAAGDIHKHRVQALKENCARHNVPVNIVQYDAEAALPFANECFDTVLVDAPCSGTGTIRHNPEIRYTLKSEDLADLAAKQLRILRNASKLVKTGGTLVYSTCSIEKEENEAVCDVFLEEDDRFSIQRQNIPDRFINKYGYARTFPHRDGMDGFFIAVFKAHG